MLLENWFGVNKDRLQSVKMVVVGVKLEDAERDRDDNGIEIPFRRFC
jgi:hypothetical protein